MQYLSYLAHHSQPVTGAAEIWMWENNSEVIHLLAALQPCSVAPGECERRCSELPVSLCECVKLITRNQPLLKCKEELDWSVSQYVVKYMLTKGVELWVQTVCGSLFVNILLETSSLSEQCLADSYMNINLTPSFLLNMTTAMADSFCRTSHYYTIYPHRSDSYKLIRFEKHPKFVSF